MAADRVVSIVHLKRGQNFNLRLFDNSQVPMYFDYKLVSFEFEYDNPFFAQVFRTTNKGWAVRSWDSIPSGAPVCEYIGVLKRCDELDSVSENDYIFEIDLLQTIKEIGGREVIFMFI